MRELSTTPWALYERDDTRVFWASRTFHGKRERATTRQVDRELAEAVVREWNREAIDPVYKASKEVTVGTAVMNFLEKVAQRVSPATVSAYKGQAGHLVRVFGEHERLLVITADSVDDYTKRRTDKFVCAVHAHGNARDACSRRRPCGEGASDHTVKKELNVLRGVLRLARRRGEYPFDPAQVLPAWDANYVPRSRVHTIEQAWKLIGALYDDERRAELAFYYGTGARHGEGKRARPRRDIDLIAGEVAIDGTKTAGSKRTVPVTPISKPFLELALAGLPQGQEHYRRWQNLRRDVLAACKRVGVPEVSLNDLRRSFATWHLEAGVSNVLVAKYLSHTTTEMVDRIYGRPSVESLKKLTEEHFASKKAAAKADEPKQEAQGDAQKPEVPVTVPRRRQRAPEQEPDGAPPLH